MSVIRLSKRPAKPARTVPLSTKAINILEFCRGYFNDDIIFGLSSNQITDRMRNTVKKAGLKNLRFHDLRHEAVSRLFELGTMQAFEIATISGHKTLHMLKRYTHLRAEDLVKKLK